MRQSGTKVGYIFTITSTYDDAAEMRDAIELVVCTALRKHPERETVKVAYLRALVAGESFFTGCCSGIDGACASDLLNSVSDESVTYHIDTLQVTSVQTVRRIPNLFRQMQWADSTDTVNA